MKNRRVALLPLLLGLILAVTAGRPVAQAAEGTPATIIYKASSPTLAYAAEELKTFLGKTTELKFVESGDFKGQAGGWRFRLVVDPAMAPYSFAVACPAAQKGAPVQVTLSGPSERCVLDAVYTMLEKVGCRFEVTGPALPEKANLAALTGSSEVVHPAVLHRGIRQHINFAMDISSYPLEEAQEYLRNLTRMRMNHITFHSYPGQWYAVKLPKQELKAGAFFYGTRFDVPDHPVLKPLVRNKKTFCIPAIEPYYDQPEEKSRLAMEWLGAMIAEAKRLGMSVQFSFELREPKMADSLATAEAIVKTYPQIDTLELITEENGGGGERSVSVDEIKKTITTYFGPEAIKDPLLAGLTTKTDGKNQVTDMLRELGHNTQVVKELQKRWAGKKAPKLAIGIYLIPHAYLEIAIRLMRKYVPAGVSYDIMPSHGAREAAENVTAMTLLPEDWKKTLISSWAEFDGNMFLQENEVEGIRQLIARQQSVNNKKPMFGLALNHWRNAENRTTLRYASQAFLRGPIPADTFYAEYAKQLGIAQPAQYAEAMKTVDDLQIFLWHKLSAIGFCITDVWNENAVAMMSWWEKENEDKALAGYEKALEDLIACAEVTRSTEGQKYLALLQNRVQCSIFHLQAIEKLQELKPLWELKDPKKLSAAQKKQVVTVCAEAADIGERYMALYAANHADRGCEGLVLNYYYGLPMGVKKMRADWGGVSTTQNQAKPGSDKPPVPVSNK